MTRWTNWSGTVSVDVEFAVPASVADLRDVVTTAARRGRHVKAIGAGHSFTAIGQTDGVLIRPDRLNGIVRTDTETGLVTVLGGTTLHELSEALWLVGLALPNLGNIDVQTVAGAVSTGTHGTGATLGGLASHVRGMQLVLADGSLLNVGDDLLPAAALGLGALGIIASVTLQCVPAFALAASEAPSRLDEALAELERNVIGNDHFEFSWFPHTNRVLTKRNNRVLPGTAMRPVGRLRRYVGDELLSNTVFEAINRATTNRPTLIPRGNAIAARALSGRDYIDRSYRVFAAPKPRVVFREMEYAVPRAAVPHVIGEIERWLARSGEQIGLPVEVRFAAADELWLSTAYGRDTGYLAVRQYHLRSHEAYFRAVEAIARLVDGRPHWGALHEHDADSLRMLYPRFDDFVAVRDRLDPHRMFGNDYLTRVLGA